MHMPSSVTSSCLLPSQSIIVISKLILGSPIAGGYNSPISHLSPFTSSLWNWSTCVCGRHLKEATGRHISWPLFQSKKSTIESIMHVSDAIVLTAWNSSSEHIRPRLLYRFHSCSHIAESIAEHSLCLRRQEPLASTPSDFVYIRHCCSVPRFRNNRTTHFDELRHRSSTYRR